MTSDILSELSVKSFWKQMQILLKIESLVFVMQQYLQEASWNLDSMLVQFHGPWEEQIKSADNSWWAELSLCTLEISDTLWCQDCKNRVETCSEEFYYQLYFF